MLRTVRDLAVILASIGVAVCASMAPAVGAAQSPYSRVDAYEPKNTAVVMDARSGEVLYSLRGDSLRYPASVTKVMTLYLAFEALAVGRLHLYDQIVVSPLAAAQPPTKLGLRAGETISVENAMHAMAVHSANDMAVALAEKVGGTESNFAAMMTVKARQLGMTNTIYVNANGLPDNRQLTTARDQAMLARAILRDFPQYYAFFSQQEFTYNGRTYVNTNRLLGKMPGVDGLKTGFTNAAGFNLAASAMRDGNRLIAVVMGSASGAARNADVESLLLTGFDVMERRARGERLVATQNLFEQAQSAGVSTARYAHFGPAYGQGEGEDDPIDVVLTRTTARPATMTVSNSMAAAKSTHPDSRGWWVQVGEFRSHRQAMSRVERLSREFARVFDEAEGSVDGHGGTYRAKFSGFNETAAKGACTAVRSHGGPCDVRGPA
jgi:D-alanyl-D-alanine carboxypeptidase (penicillin-binding protein 5/6)